MKRSKPRIVDGYAFTCSDAERRLKHTLESPVTPSSSESFTCSDAERRLKLAYPFTFTQPSSSFTCSDAERRLKLYSAAAGVFTGTLSHAVMPKGV